MTDAINVLPRARWWLDGRRSIIFARAWEIAAEGNAMHILLVERDDNRGPSVTNSAAELFRMHRNSGWVPGPYKKTLRIFEAYGRRIKEAQGTDPLVSEIRLLPRNAVSWVPIATGHPDRPIVNRLCAAVLERGEL